MMIAIIPAAGLGTRLKSINNKTPKELLPVHGKPMINWAINEALNSGISKIVVVISPMKQELKKYLSQFPLNQRLMKRGLKITFVSQLEPNGVADAIYRCKDLITESKFAVLLPDGIFIGEPPLTKLLPVAEKYKKNIVSLIKVEKSYAPYWGNCGKVEATRINPASGLTRLDSARQVNQTPTDIFALTKLADKKPGYFSTNGEAVALRTFSRYIFFREFFDYIDKMRDKIHGELDDVPVMQSMIRDKKMLGVLLKGKGFDAGNPRGYKFLSADSVPLRLLE